MNIITPPPNIELNELETLKLTEYVKEKSEKAVSKMQQICVAPGEYGQFVNWSEDLFIEEKCFPEKFPYGIGGFLSTVLDDENNSMGFADYCINQIMSWSLIFLN